MTIFVPTLEDAQAILKEIDLDDDPTLKGERTSLEEEVQVSVAAFKNTFFADERNDATFRELVDVAMQRKFPVHIVSHYYHKPELKGTNLGAHSSMGSRCYYPGLNTEGNIYVFMTNVAVYTPSNKVFITSYPDFYNLDMGDLLRGVSDFPKPEFPDGKSKKRLRREFDREKGGDVLTRIGMIPNFCHPCLSHILIKEAGYDIQIVMDTTSLYQHNDFPDSRADIPISLSSLLGPQQGLSFQVNYRQLYELLGQIFPNRVKAARLSDEPECIG